MTSERTTLVAAVIAAAASGFSLLLNLIAAWGTESRAAHRQLLAPKLAELGTAIHSTIATTNILSRARSPEAIENWRRRGALAKDSLKELRVELRYPLYGIGKPMRTLSRLPDWIEHARPFPKYAEKLTTRAQWLGWALDFAIRRSYRLGRPPSLAERLLAWMAASEVKRLYAKMRNQMRA
jgi:hypothetical protein